MAVARGNEVYKSDAGTVIARGHQFTQQEIDDARANRLNSVLSDGSGLGSLDSFFGSLELTEFGTQYVSAALQPLPQEKHSQGWREGEALAEAWLVDHKSCEFPWPFNRDLRHHRASLPGAEMVGVTGQTVAESRLAFGQVKTSKEAKTPPQVVDKGEKCLIAQATQLRDDLKIKNTLVNYLAYRAPGGASWVEKFRTAVRRYFDTGTLEIFIYGVLVRDVEPAPEDLASAAKALHQGCHNLTKIEFHGLYLPLGAIPEGPQHGKRKSKKTKGDAS